MSGETSSIHTEKLEIQKACLANLCAILLPSLFTSIGRCCLIILF